MAMAQYERMTLAAIASENGLQLARRVDASTDNEAAIKFYAKVRDAVLEHVGLFDAEDWERELVEDYSGCRTEISDGAPSVYTYDMWETFIGCRAWEWDSEASDFAGETTSMTDQASLRLYLIADALVVSLARDIAATVDDTE
jgi:hypothetical protein